MHFAKYMHNNMTVFETEMTLLRTGPGEPHTKFYDCHGL